jgi:hypothetical protein
MLNEVFFLGKRESLRESFVFVLEFWYKLCF